MAGIYLHIPFCKQACHYCNFHFSTSMKTKPEVIQAMELEIVLQKDFLQNEPVETIYFGGGTPSLLSATEIHSLINHIKKHYKVQENAEITIETNPDDLSMSTIQSFKSTPVNRFSLGVQSFFEADLQFMNRSHDALQAKQSIEWLLQEGFHNLTIDLIYGTPTLSTAQWVDNLNTAVSYAIPHLSCYGLTVEPQTALHHFVNTGKVAPVDETKSKEQFEVLMDWAAFKGYEHYEISNYAKPGFQAQHNSNYWKNKIYLGIGPSAHSYDGESRQWNVAHNVHYVQQLNGGQEWYTKEQLSPRDQYNEYVMIGLRTIWGCQLAKIDPFFRPYFLDHIQAFVHEGFVVQENNTYRLSHKGKFIADRIASELFWVEESIMP